jgi:hypothetical protein
MSVMTETDGEYIRYTIHGKEQLDQFFMPGACCVVAFLSFSEKPRDGVKFPCPIPLYPEKLNDIGVLRMQVI